MIRPSNPTACIARNLVSTWLLGVCVLLSVGAPDAHAASTFATGGSMAGDVNQPTGVAIDQSGGTLYVADNENFRVDEFNESGSFLRAFGFGVLNGARELQTCTTTCLSGFFNGPQANGSPAEPGEMRPSNVEVDPASHNVYVSNPERLRVEEFTPGGRFESMFGPGVLNAGATGTGSLTAGSPLVGAVLTTSRQFVVGQTVTGSGIPASTRITAIGAGTLTLSAPATISRAAVALTAPTPPAAVANNAQQVITIVGAPTGGTFKLTFTTSAPSESRATTVAVAYDAGATELQGDLEALSNLGAGDVAVSGPAGGPWTVEFKGRFADTNVSQLGVEADKLAPEGSAEVHVRTAAEGASAPEICTAAEVAEGDLCEEGTASSGPGAFSGRLSLPIAVDGSGNLWIGDENRIEEFNQEGDFLSEVKLVAGGDISTLVADADPASPSFGDFYALDGGISRQQVRPPASGTYKLTNTFTHETSPALPFDASAEEVRASLEELFGSGSRLSVQGSVGGPFTIERPEQALTLAISAGSVVIEKEDSVAREVVKYGPLGEVLSGLDVGGWPNALGLDEATGNVFVSDQPNGEAGETATLLEFDPMGVEMEAFGAGEVLGEPYQNALAFDDRTQRISVVNRARGESVAQSLPLPEAGPLPLGRSLTTGTMAKTTTTLRALIDPEGAATSYQVQYIAADRFKEDGDEFGAGTVSTSETGPIGSGFEAQAVSQGISGLSPGTVYRFRVVARNANASAAGVASEAASFETLPPAAIDSTFATHVTSTSALLHASIDPLGDETSYHFEYISDAAYLQNQTEGLAPFAGAQHLPLTDVAIGDGEADVEVAQPVTDLSVATGYRYRVAVDNALTPAGGYAGPVQALTTRSQGGSFTLPDDRAWELVSPPDKRGALIRTLGAGVTEAASSGEALTYLASASTESNPLGSGGEIQILSTRGVSGWASHDLATPHRGPSDLGTEYTLFSSDLSLSILQPLGAFEPALSPYASEQTPYLRHNNECEPTSTRAIPTSCYQPLVSSADVESGARFGEEGDCPAVSKCGPRVIAATPDQSHIVIEARVGLTTTPGDDGGLYEWSAGHLQLVSLMPPAGQSECGPAPLTACQPAPSPALGLKSTRVAGAISDDGSRVIWSEGEGHLYLRDTADGETLQLDTVQGGSGNGRSDSLFQYASSDGSKVFFTDTQQLTANSGANEESYDLYECEIVMSATGLQCRLTDLTPMTKTGEVSDVGSGRGEIIGGSQDGSYVYFVANGVLTGAAANARGEQAKPGHCQNQTFEHCTSNLYLAHYDGTKWNTTFIAALSGEDSPDWDGNGQETFLANVTARVSPDGEWLAFMSERPLTGYDNLDEVSGKPDEEVFLYHVPVGEGAESLVCVSCNPTGARPDGVEFANLTEGLDGHTRWGLHQGIAASLPGWTGLQGPPPLDVGQPRYLSNGGRLFFNSSDALVPQDTNGVGDVYEYEPPAGGPESPSDDSCVVGSLTYDADEEGCVSLISSGTSPEESGFLEASENGDDVFFVTNSKLASTDIDAARDIYDAHVCSGGASCPGIAIGSEPVCEGDACQGTETPPETLTPGSSVFSAPEDQATGAATGSATGSALRPKRPLTRAQELRAALKACQRRRAKARRSLCEKRAHIKYRSNVRAKVKTKAKTGKPHTDKEATR